MKTDKHLVHLDDHLCFSLYATSRSIQRLYHPTLEKHGLTYPQYLILVILYDENTLSVKTIGEKLDLSSNTLTPLLKRMEQHGLVKRIRSEEDERVVLITITNLGKTIREEAYDLPNILLERSTLSSSEWDELNRLLDRLFEDTKN
ncbi:TPA: MarR family transcriptional regulator [Enterococcus hirae]|uniref:MarR family winged helix-turn-helix transcriptional regulator n=1 Tax=Enterococcus hirae TaxID=1354 RepID=UPI000DE9650E|nr:MarR family transcriptional regulator [Enterococcus hirae]RBT50361.1 hypothetical protein EA74_02300 [Enterococcus hirae]RBT68728.1 hypothetical protein EA82_01403 [Enterococcus hirae]